MFIGKKNRKSVLLAVLVLLLLCGLWGYGLWQFSQKTFAYTQEEKPQPIDEKAYVAELFDAHKEDFVPYKAYGKRADDAVKLIALYLPQYHQFKENNEWHGKGFTEWSNVTAAKPLFVGHYQPKLPIDVGFYDLSHDEVMYRQIELAKNYGIYGFAFYYYWFSGKKLMEKPVYNYLNNKELDLPFCITWANENWSKRWDGGNHELLIEQRFSPDDFEKFAADLLPFFKDERYIKIDGRPLFMVYRPAALGQPLFSDFIDYLQRYCEQHGVAKPYVLGTRAFQFWDNPADWKLDGVIEFEVSHTTRYPRIDGEKIDEKAQFQRFDWATFIYSGNMKTDYTYKTFHTVFPAWDNSARKAYSGALIFDHTTPEVYGTWLDYAVKDTQEKRQGDEQMVFINAWNEWGEGAYLEPDRRYGYAYLDVTRQVADGAFQLPPQANNKTGIAILTAEENLWTRGYVLLNSGIGERILISGMKRGKKYQLIAGRQDLKDSFKSLVDFSYTAKSLREHAKEVKKWVDEAGFRTVYVVTPFPLILRARLEFEHLMPAVDFKFVTEKSDDVAQQWWKHWKSFKLMAAEYCKYLAVKVWYLGGKR